MSSIGLSCGVGAMQLSDSLTVPELQTVPNVSGSAVEATALTVDGADVWTFDGVATGVATRHFRLIIDGVVRVTRQAEPALLIPFGTGGGQYSCQMQVTLVSGYTDQTGWVEIAAGSVQHAMPQIVMPVADVSLQSNDPDYVVDLETHFMGSELTYSIQSGVLATGSGIERATLTLTTAESIAENEITLRASNPAGFVDQTFLFNVASSAHVFSIIDTIEGEIEITGASGTLVLTVTAPEIYATFNDGNAPGVFEFDEADLAAGPLYLVPCRLSSTSAQIDETLAVVPGLIAYDASNPSPVVTYAWQRNGADISGATDPTYVVQAADIGTALSVRETATGTLGTTVSSSSAVPVGGTSGTIYAITGNPSGFNIEFEGTLSATGDSNGLRLETV